MKFKIFVFLFLCLCISTESSFAQKAKREKPNAAISAVVREISAKNIETTIRKLASFGTRNTLSEQDNPTRGIGAARDYLYGEFQKISRDCGGCASNSAKNYVSNRVSLYGISARTPNLLNRINNLQINTPTLPNAADIRGKIIGSAISKITPSRADVQESLLDRIDPLRRVEKLSDYFLRRKRLADLRGNYMYFYTDLPKPFDKKGLVGVNVHTGQDARFVLVSEPDARFVTDETVGLLYSADGNRLQAFDFLNR